MSRATMGLLQGFGEGVATTGQFLAENRWDKQKQERLNQFRQQMREGDRAYQDQVRQDEQGFRKDLLSQQRATQLQDMERQDSNVASWGTAVDGNTQYQVGYSRTGEEVARHEAGPAQAGGQSGGELRDIVVGRDEYGEDIKETVLVDPRTGYYRRLQPIGSGTEGSFNGMPRSEAIQTVLQANPGKDEEWAEAYLEHLSNSSSVEPPPGGGSGAGQTDVIDEAEEVTVPEGWSVADEQGPIKGLLQGFGNMMNTAREQAPSADNMTTRAPASDEEAYQWLAPYVKRKQMPPKNTGNIAKMEQALATGKFDPEMERIIRQYIGR